MRHSSLPCCGFHDRAHPVDASLGVDEGAVFLEERGAGQEYMRKLRGFVEEQVLHDNAVHALSAASTCCVSGSDWATSSPWMYIPLNCRRMPRRTCSGCESPVPGQA